MCSLTGEDLATMVSNMGAVAGHYGQLPDLFKKLERKSRGTVLIRDCTDADMSKRGSLECLDELLD